MKDGIFTSEDILAVSEEAGVEVEMVLDILEKLFGPPVVVLAEGSES